MTNEVRQKFEGILGRVIDASNGNVELIAKPEIITINLTAGFRCQCAFHYAIKYTTDDSERWLFFAYLDSTWLVERDTCRWWVKATRLLPKNIRVCLVSDKGFDSEGFEEVRLANSAYLDGRLLLSKYCGDEEQILVLNRLSTDYSDPRGRAGVLTSSKPCSGAVFYEYESSLSPVGVLDTLGIPIKDEFTFKCPYLAEEYIEARAMKVLDSMGLSEDDLLAERDFLWDVAQKEKLKIVYVEMGSEFCGEYSHAEKTILLNDYVRFSMPHRVRFTLAHELGHHFLHRYILEQQGYKAQDDTESLELTGVSNEQIRYFEYQANRFASCLLMPAAMVDRYTHEVFKEMGIKKNYVYSDNQWFPGEGYVNRDNADKVVSLVAAHFKVSKEAAKLRLKNLDMYREDERLGTLGNFML